MSPWKQFNMVSVKFLFSKHNFEVIWAILVFLFSRTHTNHYSQTFCGKMTSISSRKFGPWIKICDIYTNTRTFHSPYLPHLLWSSYQLTILSDCPILFGSSYQLTILSDSPILLRSSHQLTILPDSPIFLDHHINLPFSLTAPFSSIVISSANSDKLSSMARLLRNVSDKRRLSRLSDIVCYALRCCLFTDRILPLRHRHWGRRSRSHVSVILRYRLARDLQRQQKNLG